MNVGLVDSLKYGGKLFAYFLGVVILGGGGMALGGVLAVPELQTVLDSGSPDAATLAGGLVIGVLGVTIWFVGMFGLAYKFVADAVSEGIGTMEVDTATETQTAAPESTEEITERTSDTDQPEPAAGRPATDTASNGQHQEPTPEDTPSPEPAEPEPTPKADEQPTFTGAGSEPAATEPAEDAEPRERTAEEIAFGTAPDDDVGPDQPATDKPATDRRDEPQSGTDDEDVPTFEEIEDTDESNETANSGSSRDPLAD